VDDLRKRGATIFLTTHRLEEAERLCDRVAILNTTLRTIGPPNELRSRLFATAVQVRLAAPLADPDAVFGSVPGFTRWQRDDEGAYLVTVTDPAVAAPAITRALAAAGADVLAIGESRHSLEDVYLQLVDEGPAKAAR
jgi:ABC-2 type transport system ATP-binding protein